MANCTYKYQDKVINDAEEPEPEPETSHLKPPKPKPAKKAVTPVQKKKESAPAKKGAKRAPAEELSRPQKRQRKNDTPSDLSEDEEPPTELSSEDSAASSFEDSDASVSQKGKAKAKGPDKRGHRKSKAFDSDGSGPESDQISEASLDDDDSEASAASTPPTKKKVTATRGKKQNKKVVSKLDRESSDEANSSSLPVKEVKKIATAKKVRGTVINTKSKSAISESDPDSSENENVSAKKPTLVKPDNPKGTSPVLKSAFTRPSEPDVSKADTKANDSDSSEMSIVLDEPPKTKRQRKSKDSSARKVTKTKKEVKAPKDLSESEAKIKTLQSQLVKCGVRKIWAFELKKYESDGEKISHLQGMLKDIGMTGRFSDQRAKEIKEMRELQADLDAVKEGESHWGMGSGTRRAKVQRKSLKESVESDEESNEEGEQRSASEKPEEKARAAKAELAFLGSESESD